MLDSDLNILNTLGTIHDLLPSASCDFFLKVIFYIFNLKKICESNELCSMASKLNVEVFIDFY